MTSGYRLRMTRDEMEPEAQLRTPLPPLNRVLYALDGKLWIAAGAPRVSLSTNEAWHGAGPEARCRERFSNQPVAIVRGQEARIRDCARLGGDPLPRPSPVLRQNLIRPASS
jgi:hypothetical protein